MLLGDLPSIIKLLPNKETFGSTCRLIGENIALENLEVVQCFHVSDCKNRDAILSYGLVPKGKLESEIISYEPRIFVSTTYKEVAFDYVHFEEVDVWSFYIKKE